jgi:predicted ester cyclase
MVTEKEAYIGMLPIVSTPNLFISIMTNQEDQMSLESTREIMTRYFNSEHSDVSVMAEDVVFTIMATGQEHKGREGVLGMLNYFYHIAFDATATIRTTLFGENNAMVEGEFVGKHIGEFAGIEATGRAVRVPICVVYDLENDQITQGRVYFEMPALFEQLGAGASAASQAA